MLPNGNRIGFYYDVIAGGDNLEYDAAIKYYQGLKDQMFRRLEVSLEKQYNTTQEKQISQKIQKAMKQINDGILSDFQIDDDALQKAEAGDAIESAVAGIIDRSVASQELLDGLLQKGTERHRKALSKYEKDSEEYVRELIRLVKKDLQEEDREFYNKLTETENPSSGTDAAVMNLIKSFIFRMRAQQLLEITPKKITDVIGYKNYKNSLSGYFRESAVVKGFDEGVETILTEYLNAVASQNNKTSFVIPVGGDNNEIDLLFNAAFDSDLAKTYLTQRRSVTEDNLLVDKWTKQGSFENNRIYGAQIKSWDLEKFANTHKGLPPNIGSRSVLGDYIRKEYEAHHGFYLPSNIYFLGNKECILTALGHQNVLFVDGKRRYWMDSFIKQFRSKDLYLSLNAKGDSAHDGKLRSTNDVILYNFIWNKQKTYKVKGVHD